MKKEYNNKLRNFSLLGFVMLIIVFLTIGYSSFSEDVSIISKAEVAGYDDIRVTGFSLESAEDAVLNYNEFTPDGMSLGIKLLDEDSQIKFKVSIINFGKYNYGILNILGLPNNLEYEIEGYNLGELLCDDQNQLVCNLGVEKEFFLIIKNNKINALNNSDQNLNLTVNFQQFYSITYMEGINTSLLPTTILGGTTYNHKISDSKLNVTVSMAGVTLIEDLDYTYTEDGRLIIPNVNGKIGIYAFEEYGASALDVVNTDGINFCGLTLKAHGNGVFSLNGTKNTSSNCFARLTDLLYATSNKNNLNSTMDTETIVEGNKKVHLVIDYLDGTFNVNSKEALQIQLRDSANDLIQQPIYDFYKPLSVGYTIENDANLVVLYSKSGTSLSCDNFKFRIRIMDYNYVITDEYIDDKEYTNGTNTLQIERFDNGLYRINGRITKKLDIYFNLEDDNFSYNTNKVQLVKSYAKVDPKYKAGDTYVINYEPLDNVPLITTIREISFGIRVKSGSMLDTPKITTDTNSATTGLKFKFTEKATDTGIIANDGVIFTQYLSLNAGVTFNNFIYRVTINKVEN